MCNSPTITVTVMLLFPLFFEDIHLMYFTRDLCRNGGGKCTETATEYHLEERTDLTLQHSI